ncbi:hypothetical protein ANN_21272 [Periplaneta americana]|uniref:DNA-directed DNA polymerase n=1 Tax=Periplaneta americana TaxID=6978 RepID=A0ABQ8SFK2_PERAM|nr:hypothetical protein ANN_21272 [Periplaneta americana]
MDSNALKNIPLITKEEHFKVPFEVTYSYPTGRRDEWLDEQHQIVRKYYINNSNKIYMEKPEIVKVVVDEEKKANRKNRFWRENCIETCPNHKTDTDVKGAYEKLNGDENAAPVMNIARVDVMPPSTSASEMVTSPFSGVVAIPTSTSGMVAQLTSRTDAVPMVASTSSQICSGSVFALSDRAFKNRLKTYIALNLTNHESELKDILECVTNEMQDILKTHLNKDLMLSYENRPDLKYKYDWCIDFPVGINDIAKFEKRNDISLNVFALDENDDVFPLRMCEKELSDHMDLLYINNDNTSHYCCITNFSALVRPQLTAAVGSQIAVCKRCFAYFRHNEVRSCAERLKDHESVCSQFSAVRSVFPYKDYLSFDHPEFSQKDIKEMIPLTSEENDAYLKANICHICKKGDFIGDNYKVRDHDHLTGKFRGAAHNECNLRYQHQHFIPIVLHNLSSYDGHFIVKELGDDDNLIQVLPNMQEKYISFVKNVPCMYRRKRYMQMRFLDSFRFMPSSLAQLADNLPKDKGYNHAKSVWETFNIQTLGEYSDLYLKSDTLILTDVFENFREMCLKAYDLDCMYYYTVPGLAYSAMLKLTRVKLQLIKYMTMLLLFEQGIRGGICQCVTCHAIVNDPKSENFDDSKPPSAIYYVDANNLYGFAMSQKLPYGGFAWLTDEEIPFCVEFAKPPGGKHKKLLTTLHSKQNYVAHYKLLQQAVDHGLQIVKIHRAIKFKQSHWLKQYIDLNTEMRRNANNDFEKDFFKLMNNAVFGKTMENVRKRTHFRLVSNDEKLKKLISKPYFLDRVIYAENLVGIHLRQTQILFDKALYVGMCILELSKVHMYKCIMKEQFGDRFKLCYMDTDSFIYHAQTDDLYHDLQNVLDHLDTSVYSPNHILYSLQNKGVLGKFKDEIPNSHIDEFVGLKAKVYTLKCSDFEIKKTEGY